MHSLTLQILTFNEGSRLQAFLEHATLWADRILIFDKGSTDNTIEIANKFSCEIISIPFTRQGMENPVEMFNTIKSKLAIEDPWFIWLTPGELISNKLVTEIKSFIQTPISSQVDVVFLPIKMFSFGKIRDWGFWKESYQARLINSNLAAYQNVTHNHVIHSEKSLKIVGDDEKFIIHPTHSDFTSFINSHHDYALSETFGVQLNERAQYAHQLANKFDFDFFNHKVDDDLRPYYAWKIYCYMVALKSLDSINGAHITEELTSYISKLRKSEWGI